LQGPARRDKEEDEVVFPGSATDGELQTVLGEIKHFASDLKYRFEVSLSADFLGDVHGPDSPPSPPLDIILYLRCGSSPGPPQVQKKTTAVRHAWRS